MDPSLNSDIMRSVQNKQRGQAKWEKYCEAGHLRLGQAGNAKKLMVEEELSGCWSDEWIFLEIAVFLDCLCGQKFSRC